jgi:hypothetical protein
MAAVFRRRENLDTQGEMQATHTHRVKYHMKGTQGEGGQPQVKERRLKRA